MSRQPGQHPENTAGDASLDPNISPTRLPATYQGGGIDMVTRTGGPFDYWDAANVIEGDIEALKDWQTWMNGPARDAAESMTTGGLNGFNQQFGG